MSKREGVCVRENVCTCVCVSEGEGVCVRVCVMGGAGAQGFGAVSVCGPRLLLLS